MITDEWPMLSEGTKLKNMGLSKFGESLQVGDGVYMFCPSGPSPPLLFHRLVRNTS